MKEITISVDGKEIKAQISEEELKKLTQEPEWPQKGCEYWYVCISYAPHVQNTRWENFPFDTKQLESGNCYRTKKEAEDAFRALRLIAAVAKRRKELNGDWKLDWKKAEGKYSIRSDNGTLAPNWYKGSNHGSPFGSFKKIEIVQTIIAEFRNELLWYFTEYLPSIN